MILCWTGSRSNNTVCSFMPAHSDVGCLRFSIYSCMCSHCPLTASTCDPIISFLIYLSTIRTIDGNDGWCHQSWEITWQKVCSRSCCQGRVNRWLDLREWLICKSCLVPRSYLLSFQMRSRDDALWRNWFPGLIGNCCLLLMCVHDSKNDGTLGDVLCCIRSKGGTFGLALCNNSAVDPAGSDGVLPKGIDCLRTCLGNPYCSTYTYNSVNCSLGYRIINDCYPFLVNVL